MCGLAAYRYSKREKRINTLLHELPTLLGKPAVRTVVSLSNFDDDLDSVDRCARDDESADADPNPNPNTNHDPKPNRTRDSDPKP